MGTDDKESASSNRTAVALQLPDGVARELMDGAKSEMFAKVFEHGSVHVVLTIHPGKIAGAEDAAALWSLQRGALLEMAEVMGKADASRFTSEIGRGDG